MARYRSCSWQYTLPPPHPHRLARLAEAALSRIDTVKQTDVMFCLSQCPVFSDAEQLFATSATPSLLRPISQGVFCQSVCASNLITEHAGIGRNRSGTGGEHEITTRAALQSPPGCKSHSFHWNYHWWDLLSLCKLYDVQGDTGMDLSRLTWAQILVIIW